MSSSPFVFDTPDDCLAPGDVRAIKRALGLENGSGATVVKVVPTGGGPPVPARQDFTLPGAVPPGAPGSPFGFIFPFMNDATVAVTPGVGLQFNPGSEPFTHTVDQNGILTPGGFFVNYPEFDHAKYFASTPPVALPADGRELRFSVVASDRQFYPPGPAAFPAAFAPYVQDLPADIWMCSFAPVCLDPDHFVVYGAQFSNSTIYAQYERTPLFKPAYGGPGPDYAAFVNFVPIARRNPLDPLGDFSRVAIAFNAKEGYVRWLVNDVEVYRLVQPGYPGEHRYRTYDYGNQANPVPAFPARIQATFALGNHLDSTRPLDQGVDDGAAATNKPLVAVWGVRANAFAPPPVVGAVVQPPDVFYDPVHVVQGSGPTAGQPIALFAPDFADPASLWPTACSARACRPSSSPGISASSRPAPRPAGTDCTRMVPLFGGTGHAVSELAHFCWRSPSARYVTRRRAAAPPCRRATAPPRRRAAASPRRADVPLVGPPPYTILAHDPSSSLGSRAGSESQSTNILDTRGGESSFDRALPWRAEC